MKLFHAPEHLHELLQVFIPQIIRVEAVGYASAAKKLIIVVDKETTNFELSQISAKRADRMVKLDPDGEFTRGVIVTLAPLHARSQVQTFLPNQFEKKNK
ncbi:hypothetical protein TELCIR_05821 [Teladorsagia circumcincta]|uniref:Uncharacterized protein n=1 Tax=Teladorsagia circumcincta TaxID=45464 RepID=A0A2G9UPX1_TELCI|nr:hypothetical protein TELCIR_05821 [Teladorsagia circumcincta]